MATWSKEVFAANLKRYMESRDINQKELAEIVNVSAASVNDWVKAKKYPRIDKIEMMADYFGILKSDLIEDKGEDHIEMQKKAGIISDAVLRMKTDPEFFSLIEDLMKLESEKFKGVKQLVDLMQ